MDVVLNSVPVKVSSEMNEKLLRPFTGAEVKEALFQMFPTKAPGQMVSRLTFSNITGNCVEHK
jgi:hypothetical protein